MDFPQRVNGWALYAHPCFQETYDALVAEVETLKGKDPENYRKRKANAVCNTCSLQTKLELLLN